METDQGTYRAAKVPNTSNHWKGTSEKDQRMEGKMNCKEKITFAHARKDRKEFGLKSPVNMPKNVEPRSCDACRK